MPNRSKHAVYVFATVILSLIVALSGAEFVLAWQTKRIQAAEKIDPGFLLYDGQLGWRMAPDWHGRHLHHDFDVRYNTTAFGLRGVWPAFAANQRRYALLGDSFTFGLGVNDDETFAARLHQAHPDAAFLNIGLAGYSTDQQYLYLQDHLASWQAGEVWLIVYLANDLFDNTLAYPLQAQMGKPYFTMAEGNLVLRNVPVPADPPPQRRPTLASMVLGEDGARALSANPLSRYELIRRLGVFAPSAADAEKEFPRRFAYPLALFFKLVEAMRETCSQQGITLKVILLPGRSFVEQPGAYSAAFQDYFRRSILAEEQNLRVKVVDLAGRLLEWRQNKSEPLFHPNEGHLNAAGNRVVADMLWETAL